MTVEIIYAPALAARWPFGHTHSWIASDFEWSMGFIYPIGPRICSGCGTVTDRLVGKDESVCYQPLWRGDTVRELSGEPAVSGREMSPDASLSPRPGVSR